MSDITVFDAVVPEEFASECYQRAEAHARSANWDSAGNWHTAGQLIDGLQTYLDEERERILTLKGRIYELEETIDGQHRHEAQPGACAATGHQAL